MARANHYSGTCSSCRRQVAPGDGFIRPGGLNAPRWRTYCSALECLPSALRADPAVRMLAQARWID